MGKSEAKSVRKEIHFLSALYQKPLEHFTLERENRW